MDAKQLLDRMTDPAAPVPHVRDIPALLAHQLAAVADRLTQEEIDDFVALGVVIGRRTTRVVPIIGSVD